MPRLSRLARVALVLLPLLAAVLGRVAWPGAPVRAAELERLFQNGDRRALIIHDPGAQPDFMQQLTRGFAEGLAASGWQVRRIAADAKDVAALDLESYDTIVFATEVSGAETGLPIRQVLDVLPPLQRRFCAGLVVAKDDSAAAESRLRARLLEKECFDPLIWAFWWERRHEDPGLDPADPRSHREVALALAMPRAQRSTRWWLRYRLQD